MIADPLSWFVPAERIVAVVDTRVSNRRDPDERRGHLLEGHSQLQRRVMVNAAGRRAGDRRAALPYTGTLSLPEIIRPYESELRVFSAPSRRHYGNLEAAWLMLELQAGSVSALSDLYRRFYAELKGVAGRVLHDSDEAEDVVQEVFSILPKAASRFDASCGSAGGLLCSIARHLAISRARHNSWLVVFGHDGPAGRIDTTEGERSFACMDDTLDDMTQGLPLLQRQVLWLRYSLDLPFAEIATVLGRGHANVRQAHHRALTELARAA